MLTDDPEVLVFSDVADRASHAIDKDVAAFPTPLTPRGVHSEYEGR